jgi:L,D-transpeptidase ErfK/SrfK
MVRFKSLRWLRIHAVAVPVLCMILPAGLRADVFALEQKGDTPAVVGKISYYETAQEDTLSQVAEKQGLGYEEIVLANPDVDSWLPGAGKKVVLPTSYVLPNGPTSGVVINIAEYRLYYYYKEGGQQFVATFPVSIGRMDWNTPIGKTSIISKVRNPSWYPPESVREEHRAEGRELPRIVPAGPDNPLGEYALRLGIPGYLIHGTNRPAGLGMRVTHGCIRMYPVDIEWFFPRASKGSSVRIVNQPYKTGWRGDDLYLEVHPMLQTGDEDVAADMTMVIESYVNATKEREASVDWNRVVEVFRQQRGWPEKVGRATGATTEVASLRP